MLQNRRGVRLKVCFQRMQKDSDPRTGPKAIRNWLRQKNDKPPQPPKTRLARLSEITKVKQPGRKFLRILMNSVEWHLESSFQAGQGRHYFVVF